MKSFCIGTRAWIVVLVILLVAPAQLAVSRQQFGRTSETGTWDDGNWKLTDGSLGSPGASDSAYIGYQEYGWLGNVSVSLSGNAEVANLILGDGTNTGALTINTGANMTTGGLFSYSGSSLIVDGSLFVDYAILSGTNFEINGSVNVSSYIDIDGGVVIQAGDMSAQSLSLGRYGEATTFNRTSGTLTLDSLRVDSGSTLDLTGADSVNSIAVSADSELSFTQLAGQTTGLELESLLLDSDANLTVIFDNPDYNGFNWGLRVFGDRQSEMNDWLAGGQLSSNFAGAGIFYDVSSFGDYTYLGAFSAVPEPASISLVFLALACGTVRMRRRRVGR